MEIQTGAAVDEMVDCQWPSMVVSGNRTSRAPTHSQPALFALRSLLAHLEGPALLLPEVVGHEAALRERAEGRVHGVLRDGHEDAVGVAQGLGPDEGLHEVPHALRRPVRQENLGASKGGGVGGGWGWD